MSRLSSFAFAALLLMPLAACEVKLDVDKTIKDAEKLNSKGAKLITSVRSVSTAALSPYFASATDLAGQSTPTGLQSLKYYILSITICKEAQLQGTGFSGQQGCITLYDAPSNPLYEYDAANYNGDVATAQTNSARGDDNPNFIDLMNPDSLALLANDITLSTEHAGDYKFGFVGWYMPIKVKAQIDGGNGDIFYTHDGTTAVQVFGDGWVDAYTVSSTPFTQGPAEEAVVIFPNGGSWFKFQKPFTVTAADITAGTEFVLDMVFNPEGLVKAYGAGINGANNRLLYDGADKQNSNAFTVPMLDLTPVPHRATESVEKETYVFPIVQGDGHTWDIRAELYYVKEDTAKTIYGVDYKALLNAATDIGLMDLAKVSFLETAADGSLSFQDYSTGLILTGLQRSSETGAAVTATIYCNDTNHLQFDGCATGGSMLITGTMVGVSTVSAPAP